LDLDVVWGGEWGQSKDGCIRWGVEIVREEAIWGINVGYPIVTSGEFAA